MSLWLLLSHVAGLIIAPFCVAVLWILLPLQVAVLLSLRHCWLRHVSRQAATGIHALTWLDGNLCKIERADGVAEQVFLMKKVFIQPWLVILYFRKTGIRQHSLVIFPDMLDSETFRRLRVRLGTELGQTRDCL